VVSFLVTACLPLSGVTPRGDLNGNYTDHVRHPYVAWVALHRGLWAVYTTPLGELTGGIDYPQATTDWLDVPLVYPPGSLVLFLPVSVIGKWVPLSPKAFGQLCILYLLALSHLAFYTVLRTLDGLPAGGRWAVGVLAWLVLMRLGLQGQYDAAWLACGVLMLRRLAEGRPASALRWVGLAALLHYRAVILVAVGVVALVGAVRHRPVRGWPWATLLWVASVGAVCGVTFAAMAPLASRTEAATPSILGSPSTVLGVLAASALAAAIAWRGADGLVAASVGVGCVLAFVDTRHWWHAAMLLLVPMAVGVLRVPRWPTTARLTLITWMVMLQTLVWHGNPLWLFRDLGRFVRMSG
jgi:hypothetical protein